MNRDVVSSLAKQLEQTLHDLTVLLPVTLCCQRLGRGAGARACCALSAFRDTSCYQCQVGGLERRPGFLVMRSVVPRVRG